MSLLVIGTVAFDAIETPFGKTDKIIGGAATYISVSASYFKNKINLVSVVGEDFPKQTIEDLQNVANCFSGVNIKLMKCGGLWPAYNLVQSARKLNLKVFLGSMNESSCAIMAAAVLSPIVDFVDLDGPWLINNNPFNTPALKNGALVLPNKPGLGAVEIDSKIN